MSHEVAAMAAADRSDIAALTGAVRGLIGEMRRARREAGTLALWLQPVAANAASDIAATAETVAAKIRATSSASQPQLEQERPGMDDAAAQTFTGPAEAGAEHGASSFVDEGAGDPIGLSSSEVLALAEEYRLLALAELDHLGAAVSTAVAALRWNGGGAQRIADTLTLASHHLAEALDFESARVRLLTGEPQPQPEAAPAEHQAPAEAPSPILDDVSARAAEEHRQRALKALVETIEWGHRVIKTLQDNSADPRPAVDAMSWLSLAGGAALEAVNSRATALSGSGPETPAAPAPAPSFPPESHLVAATRSLEAVKSHADQALMGLQFAPHEHGVMIDVMQGLRRHAEASAQAHLHYAAAQVVAAG